MPALARCRRGVETAPATVLRESLVRFDDLPLVARVPSLPALEPGSRVELAISRIDLLELTLALRVRGPAGGSCRPT